MLVVATAEHSRTSKQRDLGNHGSIWDSRPIAISGCPRGHTVAR